MTIRDKSDRPCRSPGDGRQRGSHSGLIPRFASALDVPEANVAAALSHLTGLTLLDTLIGVGQLSNLSDDDLAALVRPAISRYLTPSKQPARRAPHRQH